MVALGRWFTHSFLLTLKFLSGYVHRSTLPQSALAGCQLPQRGSRDGLHHSTGYSLISGVSGDFHRPYEGSDIFTFYHSSDDTPSVTPVGRDSSLREGAGKRSHSTGYSLKSGAAGDFHRPYETQKTLRRTVQSATKKAARGGSFFGMGVVGITGPGVGLWWTGRWTGLPGRRRIRFRRGG